MALSADAFLQQIEEANRTGIDDYLTKPVQIEKLIQVLNRHLAQDESGNDMSSTKPPLPDSVNKQALEEFRAFSNVPHYRLEQVEEHARKILELCEDYDSPYPELLKRIQKASRSGHSQQIAQIIREALHEVEPEH